MTASAGKNDPMASSATVTSSGVPCVAIGRLGVLVCLGLAGGNDFWRLWSFRVPLGDAQLSEECEEEHAVDGEQDGGFVDVAGLPGVAGGVGDRDAVAFEVGGEK